MSHKATSWLAGLDAALMGPSEFRVLFHLCDCHNPAQGCFPTQSYLIAMTGASNGTVNNALNLLEQKGLIQRHRERDGRSHRQKPTRYMLGFEIEKPQEPSPETGDGKTPKPSPETGDGAVSRKRAKPSPVYSKSRLQPTGEKPVIEPVINLRAQNADAIGQKKQDGICEFWAARINAGQSVTASAISIQTAQQMVARNLVDVKKLQLLGVAC